MLKKTLYFGNPFYLSKKNEQLVITDPVAQGLDRLSKLSTIPIEDIGLVVLDNPQITISQGLMQSLIENNVALITCNARHHPVGLFLPLDSNDIQSQRFRYQIEATEPLKKQLWQQTIQAKIKNQALLLQQLGKQPQALLGMVPKVRSGDPDNYEAQAAVRYWGQLFDESLHFRRDPEGQYPNNLLNYGYAILRATVARAIVGAGLLPTLGIHHSNKYNAYCLADDMMEPYRPFVDSVVVKMVAQNQGEILDKHSKAELLMVPNIDVAIRGERSPLMVAVQRCAVSLVKAFAGENRKLLCPEWYNKSKTDLDQQKLDFEE